MAVPRAGVGAVMGRGKWSGSRGILKVEASAPGVQDDTPSSWPRFREG